METDPPQSKPNTPSVKLVTKPTKEKPDEVETPNWVWNFMREELKMTANSQSFWVDACPKKKEYDALSMPWMGGAIFCNPPFHGDYIERFLKKGREELRKRNCDHVIYLLPVRAHMKWYDEHVLQVLGSSLTVYHFQGYIKFREYRDTLPYPMMLLHYHWPSNLDLLWGDHVFNKFRFIDKETIKKHKKAVKHLEENSIWDVRNMNNLMTSPYSILNM
jgi:hypothetical protein